MTWMRMTRKSWDSEVIEKICDIQFTEMKAKTTKIHNMWFLYWRFLKYIQAHLFSGFSPL